MEHRIAKVLSGSVGEELGIEKGDVLVSVNGDPVEDVFDWRALIADESFTLLIRKASGEEWEIEVELDEDEDMGLVFENDLMSNYRSCANRCIFCFIDQMPKGLRETLYFKDDDSRLSFLQGNYITLTNMRDKEISRIIRYRMEPMNISVHTTDPELRVRMLGNRRAGMVLRYLKDLYDAEITMNGQIVLCKGWNDGEALHKTLVDLLEYAPVMQSVSVVPVGLTKHREGLQHLDPFEKEDAEAVIREVEQIQREAMRKCGMHFVHASDEFYITAGREFPPAKEYDGYPQLYNGVGMARLLLDEAEAEVHRLKKDGKNLKQVFATGMAAAPLLRRVRAMVDEKFPGHDNEIVAIRNDFFGEHVTVAGLVTGQDLLKQLQGIDSSSVLYLPNCMLRSGEEVFLDDVTRTDLEKTLGVRTRILQGGGDALVRAMCGKLKKSDLDLSHGAYELTDI